MNSLLTRYCTLGEIPPSSLLEQQALDVEKLRNERNDLYFRYVEEYMRYMQMHLEREPLLLREELRTKLRDQLNLLKKITEDFEVKFLAYNNQVGNGEAICLAFQTFLRRELLTPQVDKLPFSVDGLESREKESAFRERCARQLDEEFPNSNEYVYVIQPSSLTKQSGQDDMDLQQGNNQVHHCYSIDVQDQLAESDSQKEKLKRWRETKDGEKVVESVVESFAKWGRENRLRMFIVKNILHNRRQLHNKHSKQIEVASVPKEWDVIIICEQVGVIFIQVKYFYDETDLASINKVIQETFEHLLYNKLIFLVVNGDLDFVTPGLPTWGFIAMPFVTENRLEELQLCSKHKHILLGSETLNLSKFRQIKIITNPPFWHRNEFRWLGARYAFQQGSPQTLSTAVKETSEIIGNQLFVEFPSQEAVLNKENVFQVIKGDFGTGKTVLLCRKAVASLTKYQDSKVVFLICLEVDKYFWLHTKVKEFPLVKLIQHCLMNIGNNTVNKRQLEICTLGDLYREHCASKGLTCKKYVYITAEIFTTLLDLRMAENVNLLIDELPLQLFEECKQDMIDLAIHKQANIVWTSIATQSLYKDTVYPPNTLTKHSEIFHYDTLKHNMRNSHSILKLMKFISDYTNEQCKLKVTSGVEIEGRKPILYRVETCYCPTKPSKEEGVFCPCLKERLRTTLKHVHKRLKLSIGEGNRITYVIEHIYNDSFASPIFEKLLSLFESIFTSLGIKKSRFQWLTLACKSDEDIWESYDPNAVKIVDWTTFVGSESAVVVNIDFFAMSQWSPYNALYNGASMVLSRCTSQYVHIALQGDEPKTFIEQHIKMFKSYIDKHKNEACGERFHEQSLQGKEKFVHIMERLKIDVGKLLNILLEKGLIIEEHIPSEEVSRSALHPAAQSKVPSDTNK